MMMSKWLFAALICATLCASAGAQFQVVVVDDDPGPGVDALSLQDGIDMASDDDVVLVRSGVYAPFMMDGKGLSIVAAAGATVTIDGSGGPSVGTSYIRMTPAGRWARISGLDFLGTGPTDQGLWIEQSDGIVFVENCTFSSLNPCVRITFGANVVIQRSTLTGYTSNPGDPFHPTDGGLGLTAWFSKLTLIDSQVQGGAGASSADLTLQTAPGGMGLEVVFAELISIGSTITGGKGGPGVEDPLTTFCEPGDDGGDGLWIDTGSSAILRDTTTTGGSGGTAAGPCGPGTSGDAIVLDGTLLTLPQATRSLTVTQMAQPGDPVSVDLVGDPTDNVLLLMSVPTPGAFFKLAWAGALLVDPSAFLIVPLGSLPGGVLSLPGTAPSLPIGITAVPIHMQYVAVTPGGKTIMGSASTLTVAVP
jgi:hypothetical protein